MLPSIMDNLLPFAFDQSVASHVMFMDGGVIAEQGKLIELFGAPKEERTRQFLNRIWPELNYSI